VEIQGQAGSGSGSGERQVLTTRGSTADSTPDAEVREDVTRKTRKRWKTTEAVLHLKRKPYEYQMAGVMKAAPAGLEAMQLDGVCNPIGERTSAKGLSSLERRPRLRFTFTAPLSASLTHGVSSNCLSADSRRGVCSVSAGSHRRAPGCRAMRCRRRL
jgi:hypothetical protein